MDTRNILSVITKLDSIGTVCRLCVVVAVPGYQVSHFLAYMEEERGGERGDSVALLSVVNIAGTKELAKRKLHRNKISCSLPSPPCYRCLVTYFSITLLT